MKVGETDIESSHWGKLPGVKIYSKLTFNERLIALSRVPPYMNESRKRILMNSFFYSQFSYCLLLWMFHSRTLNKRNQSFAWKIVCNNKNSSYWNLWVKYRSASKIFPVFQEPFNKKNLNYKLWHPSKFTIPKAINVYNMCDSITCLGAEIWNMIPTELKKISSVSTFKNAIKEWCCGNCPWKLCRRCLQSSSKIVRLSCW